MYLRRKEKKDTQKKFRYLYSSFCFNGPEGNEKRRKGYYKGYYSKEEKGFVSNMFNMINFKKQFVSLYLEKKRKKIHRKTKLKMKSVDKRKNLNVFFSF